MSLSPDQITIAITVYSRRQYIERAVESALNQSIPVKVIVVEDCGPDQGLQEFVRKRFGSRIAYFRNPQRRGLFDNWNACMEYCQTPWLSILHDDDYLAPKFVEAMLSLQKQMPDCGLYFGKAQIVDDEGKSTTRELAFSPIEHKKVELLDGLKTTPFLFPGQLFRVAHALALGGFRKTSFFCGDWEMWMKLIACHGAAQTNEWVACMLSHTGWDRGTNVIIRSGRHYPLNYVQYKRNLKLLREKGIDLKMDRIAYQRQNPVPTRFLLGYGAELPPRILMYHIRLLLMSASPHFPYFLFKTMARIGGPAFIRLASRIWNSRRVKQHNEAPIKVKAKLA